MFYRNFWTDRLEDVLSRGRIAWLSGVRRVGKTLLCQSLPDAEYFDCELASVRRQMADPEAFWGGLVGKRVVVDEVQRLRDPSELLKVAADHFPSVRIVATGSSTLDATRKFRDSLAGRKLGVWLTPMILDDAQTFGNSALDHRLRRGGLPPFFLSPREPGAEFQEWFDSYWARDIEELFRLERRSGFQTCLELLLANSGGVFEATKYAGPSEISRTTVKNYLRVLEITHVAHVIQPFSTHKPTELTSAPKVYGFDTGFVCYARGWTELRPDDIGNLWEHYVLNELHARWPMGTVKYWRDTHGHEVDFVLPLRGRTPLALEAKRSASAFSSRNLAAFRRRYPEGLNWVVCTDVGRPFQRTEGDLVWEFLGLSHLADRLRELPPA